MAHLEPNRATNIAIFALNSGEMFADLRVEAEKAAKKRIRTVNSGLC